MSNDTPDEYYDFVNTAYWRTCSLLLEETVRKGFIAVSRMFSATFFKGSLSQISKVGSVYPTLVILSKFRMGQHRDNGKTYFTLQS